VALVAPNLVRHARGAERGTWFFRHIIGMFSAYIATFTAFAVTNLEFLPPVVLWLLPSVVGSLGISLTVRHYKARLRRGRELGELVALRGEGA
jgi:hypothetical protein